MNRLFIGFRIPNYEGIRKTTNNILECQNNVSIINTIKINGHILQMKSPEQQTVNSYSELTPQIMS